MKFERKKNVARSVSVGFFSKIFDCIFQFIIRTILLNTLGVLYLGLNSLFVSVLGVLSLTELGFSSVIIFSMYKPIAEDDIEKTKSLLSFYRRCYRTIGLIILFVGLLFTPFIKLIISGEYPQDTNIYLLYLINLANTVISYFLFAYKSSIFEAHQRNDLVSAADLVTNIIKYGLQTMLLVVLKNYYAYLIIVPVATIIRNLLLSYFSQKYYPQLSVEGAKTLAKSDLDEIKIQIKGVVLHKAGNAVFQYADSIVISAFWGLGLLGIYNNYYYLLTAVGVFMAIISNSLMPGVGNLIATESKEKNIEIFKQVNYFYFWVASIGSCCFMCMYQPFIRIWMGEEYLLDISCIVFLSLLFYVLQVNNAVGIFKGALGMYWQDRYRPLLSAGINLGLNLILSKFIGINGVIISSIVANILVDFPYVTIVFFKNYFRKSPRRYMMGQYFRTIISAAVLFVTYYFVSRVDIDGYLGLVTRLIVCLLVSNTLFIFFNIWDKTMKELMNKIVWKVKSRRRV